jgi:hypothetical protein
MIKSTLLFKSLALLFICLALFTTCKKNSPTDSNNYTADCSGAAKSYKTDVAPVIQSSCSTCHSNFSSYSQVFNSRSSIKNTIENGTMPKSGSLSDAQKNAVICWINSGGANN